jgi:uncharacterized membrane protein YagU involved in acid resistance
MKRDVRDVIVDAASGAVGGFIASWIMGKVMGKLNQVGSEETIDREMAAIDATGEPPTEKVARVAMRPFGIELSSKKKEKAATAVHYAYGTIWGAAFGVLGPRLPIPPVATGAALGAALWLVSDELLLPLLRLARAPWKYPVSYHGKAFASHVLYGLATEATARVVSTATNKVVGNGVH